MTTSTLAILIGISRYRHLDELPGCDRDLAAVRDLLTFSGKVGAEHLLVIDHNNDSTTIKTSLAEFISRHRSAAPPAEVFFYFSGHGKFDDDFRCCLPDYEQ